MFIGGVTAKYEGITKVFRHYIQKLQSLKNRHRSPDRVFVNGLVVNAIIGIFDFERKNKQRVIIDVDMLWDNLPASKSEDIHLALDYKEVSQAIEVLVVKSEFLLVETMAEGIAELLLKTFSVLGVKVRVTKPDALSHIDGVGVEIIRGSFH